jgi:signal transduction histidine kinase
MNNLMKDINNKRETGIMPGKAKPSLRMKQLKKRSPVPQDDATKLTHQDKEKESELEKLNAELVQARFEVLDAVRKYTDLYDYAPTGYFTLSREGYIIGLNLQGAEMLGKVRSKLVYNHFVSYVSEDTKHLFNLFLNRVFKSKVKEVCELVVGGIDTPQVYVHVSGIVPEKSEVCFLILTDVTTIKKSRDDYRNLSNELEQRVRERTKLLEEANAELESFCYSISHDLRTPLRHISGFADILKNEYYEELPDEARHYLDTICGSVQLMGTLIEDLLKLSKIGRAKIQKEPILMNKVVEDAIGKIQSLIENREVDWNIASLPDITGDYNLVRQVWINLLDNAVKYSCNREKAIINVGFKEEPEEIIFYVKDNGVGFNMNYAFKLFTAFKRLHSSSKFPGTGIGLANVRTIISRHGGRTWAEAEEDRGATFYFSLPKSTELSLSH